MIRAALAIAILIALSTPTMGIDCAGIRQAVTAFGPEVAKQWAISQGLTTKQIQQVKIICNIKDDKPWPASPPSNPRK